MEIQPVSKKNDDAELLSTTTDVIEHHVSKLDTLPGIAIKYGVEVADIKRINGLTADFQIYAHGVLQIPLPGRHRPSDTLPLTLKSHKHRRSESRARSWKPLLPSTYGSKIKTRASALAGFDGRGIERGKVTPAMDLLQGYYGLSMSENSHSDNTDILHPPDTDAHSEEEPFTPPSVSLARNNRPPFSNNRESSSKYSWIGHQEKNKQADKALISVTLGNAPSSGHKVSAPPKEFEISDTTRISEHKVAVRRRSKVEGVDNNEAAAGQDSGQLELCVATAKAPLPKPKASRGGCETELDISAVRLLSFSSPFAWTTTGGNPAMDRGSVVVDLISKIRKSASTSNLSDEEVGDAANQSSITFLEGLIKPSNRRNKAALD